ncbi:response regulator transcription factor [Streptacidiphilus jiangxiensis]|uniref:DNA-binding response regulator, NarL/FixJ family, contains REC and HTH domains n=1 Tax=Streptacidiphilus jiangxiensis TaxID=235985 RepID=A0A1H7VMD9_STRJI|nr:response regulator transcription factor [Streptacidiphilus jiangxiensis]SEM10204.1 DNA-binding response regulator, NarL/FixJ family, contains REC and HTH domains [Streptacidiphilus jiangxiensis]
MTERDHIRIGVVILASRPLIRAALRTALAGCPDIGEVAEATTAYQLDHALSARECQTVLIDDADPAWDTLAVVRRVREERVGGGRRDRVGVVILAESTATDDALSYLRAGADALVPNDGALDDVAAAVRAVAQGHAVVPPPLARKLVDLMGVHLPVQPGPDQMSGLTAREHEIFELIATGMSNQEVAQSLVLSEKTVKFHVSNLLRKLGVRNRTQAIVYARDNYLLGAR